MKYIEVGNQVLVLFLVIILGYIAGKMNIIDKKINKGLTELILNITLPAMIIVSFGFTYSREMMFNSMILLILSIGIHIFLLFISRFLYYKYPDNMSSVARFATIFSNCGFMGYPVVKSIYGEVGVFYTAIFNLPFNILIWTVGVSLFTNTKKFSEMKKVLVNPGVISAGIGLLLFTFSIKLPLPINMTLKMVGDATTPLSMIVIGAMLSEINIKEIFTGFELYFLSFIRLVAVPLVGLIVLKVFGINGVILGIPVLIMAMPGAANTVIVSEKYGADSLFASRAVFVTTVLSIITIPLIILLL